MSFFIEKMFGKGKKDGSNTMQKPTATQESLQKLSEIIEILNKKQQFLEEKIQKEMVAIKKNGTTNKKLAIQALRRKKRYEEQLRHLDGTLATIELQKEALEAARTNTEICDTMKMASDALKATQKHFDVDKVHDIFDDIAEQQEISREIAEVISKPIGYAVDDDDEELERELEELEQEDLDKKMMAVGLVSENLPSVPSTAVPSLPPTPSEEEEELKRLQQWAA